MATDGLICWQCGKPTGIIDRVGRGEMCPHCQHDLRCCRGCRHFNPTRRFQCNEKVDTNITNKEKSNFCDFFQMRNVIKGKGGMSNQVESKETRRKKLDDLFND